MFRFLKDIINVSCEDVFDLRDYIAYIAHEIRTPLNSIYGNLTILRMEENLNNRYLDNAALSTEYLMCLIDSILTISEIENDTNVINIEAVTLEELFKYPQGILEWAAEKKNIELQFRIEETVYQYLYLNKAAVQQIIINLVSNAIKYTNEGGRVVCRVTERCLEEKRIKLYLEVKDNGIGMEADFAAIAGTEFTREGRSGTVSGSGLGLSITRRLVELLNGEIKIETKAEHGTRVLVELEVDGDDVIYNLSSLANKENEIAQICENINEYALPKRALVAEDETANMEIICKYLEILGVEADRAYDGDEVIEIFKTSEINFYDVLLIDISLPKKSGIEAALEIRKLDRLDKGLPIIVITADTLYRHRTDILSGEIDGYIIKPYSLEDIRSALLKR